VVRGTGSFESWATSVEHVGPAGRASGELPSLAQIFFVSFFVPVHRAFFAGNSRFWRAWTTQESVRSWTGTAQDGNTIGSGFDQDCLSLTAGADQDYVFWVIVHGCHVDRTLITADEW